MIISRRQMMILLPAAAVAWKSVLAGTPEASPNYKMSDHWWGMLIDIPKCIGCGNCVRACATENDVPDGHFRTWVERYHRSDWPMTESGEVTANPLIVPKSSRDGGKKDSRWPPMKAGSTSSFQDVQPLLGFALHAGLPGGATFISPDGVVLVDRHTAWAARIACRPALWLPLHSSHQGGGGQVHALLPPDYQGADDRLLRGLPDRRASTGRSEGSKRPDPRVPEDAQRAGVEAADGHRREALLQRPGRLGAVKTASQ